MAPIQPFEPVYVEVDQIEKINPSIDQSFFACDVRDGDWDQKAIPINEYYLYQSFVNHFQQDVKWEETELFSKARQKFKTGSEFLGYTDMNRFKEHLEETDKLYEQIRDNGYRSQREIAANSTIESIGGLPPGVDEVRVNIGRNGEIIAVEGQHRFIIAKLVNVDTIPTRVLLRHKEWQEVRDAIYEGRASSSLDHPDLNNL